MIPLTEKNCVPCKEGTPSLSSDEITALHDELQNNWIVINEHHLEKEFKFSDFKTALAFTNKIAELAEKEEHHPDIHLAWGRVRIVLWTHKINGLTENDFVLAAKCDTLYST